MPFLRGAVREGNVALWGNYVLPPQPVRDIVRIAAGGDWSLALDRQGRVHFWGAAYGGRSVIPPEAAGDVIDVGALGGFPFVLKRDGTLIGWGSESGIVAGPPAGVGVDVASIPTGSGSFHAIARSGALISWNDNPVVNFGRPGDLGPVLAVASGSHPSGPFALAQKADGSVVIWGSLNGVLPAPVPPGITEVKALGAFQGNGVALALTRSGTVKAWLVQNGKTSEEPDGPILPTDLGTVTAMAAGWAHAVALRADGTVRAWGRYSDYDGQGFEMPASPPGLRDVVAVAAGNRHCLALKADGTVVQWGAREAGGDFSPGQLATKIAISGDAVTLLRADGTVSAFGRRNVVPDGLTDIVDLSTSGDNALLIKRDGSLLSFGGLGAIPPGVTDVVAVAAGAQRVAVRQDGTAFEWGYTDGRVTPDVSAGAIYFNGQAGVLNTVFIRKDTTPLAFGNIWVNPPPGTSNLVSISVSMAAVAALRNDGTVLVWGSPDSPFLNIPAEARDVTKVVMDDNVALAVRADGNVVGWGRASVPAGIQGAFDVAVGGGVYGVIYKQPEPPTLTRHCPLVADPGAEITLEGTGLTWVTNVIFNGVAQTTFKRVSDFMLTMTIPAGATTGSISVEGTAGNATDPRLLVVPNGLGPSEAWRVLHFGAPGNAGDAADTADADGDGMTNLLEYQINSDPRRADRQGSIAGKRVVTEGGRTYFEFTVRDYVRASDVRLSYEFSLDLNGPFRPFTGPVEEVATLPTANCQTVERLRRVEVPNPGGPFYLRYFVRRP